MMFRCRRRLRRAEALMWNLVHAHDVGEMGQFQAALEAIRRYLNRR